MRTTIDRRRFIAAGASLMIGTAARSTLPAIRQAPKARIIIDNDFAGDPDGLIALAHQLATKAARPVLVTTSALDAKLAALGGQPAGATAAAGKQAAIDLMKIIGLTNLCPVIAGSERFGVAGAQASAAARAIVAEAMRDDPLPLFFTCGGPLTNLAQALQLEPAIADRMTLVWIGGADYPQGGSEYNMSTDLEAARTLIERSRMPIWQIPASAYRQLQMSVAEMSATLRPMSATTAWLYGRYADLPPFVQLGGAITLGDSPMVLLTSVSAESSASSIIAGRRLLDDSRYGAEIPGRSIRLFTQLDARLALADFLALMHPRRD